ncbi:beta-hexosaminidase 2 [Actinidia rufa]|uniref:beta-N-acetylhexosaminidase n=1 Tax=Actinidia rufa TaxID=165716 RepID=A0A7J0FVI9_9ERIC|nr:beta-hexosaminidase 2 [Actinidia rufa]
MAKPKPIYLSPVTLSLLILSLLFFSTLQSTLNVWPKPRTFSWPKPQAILLSKNFTISSPTHKHLDAAVTRYLRQVLTEHHRPLVPTDANLTNSPPIQTLTLAVTDLTSPLHHGVNESYTLSIPAAGASATIAAETPWGAMRGLETFSQLVWGDPARVASGIFIEDFPIFEHRGVMLDTSRNFYAVDDILRTIRAMSENKLNVFHWHITDSHSFPLVIESEPDLAGKGSYGAGMEYSPEDVKTVVEFGLDHGVRVLPEIDMPGFWWRWSLEMGILSTLPPRPKARKRQYFNSDQLMSILMVALARSHRLVLPRSRGFGDKQPLERSRATSSDALLTSYRPCLRDSSSVTSPRLWLKRPPLPLQKGVVISEGSETTSGKRALDDGSKGKQVAQSPEPKKARIDTGASGASARPPVTSGAGSSARQVLSEALGPQASVMASAATAEKILAGVVLPADKEKVDRLTFDQVVTKFLHVVGQGVILGSSLAVRSRDFAEGALNQKVIAESAEMEMVRAQNRAIELEGALAEEKAKGRKLAEDVDARGKVISKLEARISDLEKSQSLTQGRIIAAFKESDDFLEAVRGSASSYFGDGFDFCKRQLAKQYPDLGVDLEDVEMDQELLAKEEAEAEKRAAEEEAAEVEHRRTLSRRHVDGKFNAGQFESAGKWSNGGKDGFYTSEVGTSRDLGRRGRLITALPCVYINGVNLFICTFPLLSKCCSVSDSHLAVNKSTVPFMSFNTNLGGEESEQSLPSWISDHLGAKSYIDETTQSTSSPIPTNSSKMDTSSLNKESNVMSQADLDNLGTTYSFPQGVRLRIPRDGETILSARQGEVAFYEAAFLAGLRFPIHPTIREILIHYQICPAQLSPNAWRSVICSLVIWRIFKRHLSCGEFRYLYSLSPLPDSGWYYFKARPEKNLLRGSPSNVKGWKTRFFFASGDEWELAPGTAASESFTTSSQILGNTSCNKLPTLSEVDAKRMEAVFGKIEPGGYFEVSKVLNSRTFKRHFAGGCSALSTSGGDNTTSGDEGEFGTGEDSVEYLGVIRRGIGGAIRRALPGIPDETLLRWLGGKVKDPFTNLLSGTSGSSSDSGSDSIRDSELPPELRSDAMSSRGKAVAEKAKKAAAAKHPTKGVVIREKRTREGDLVIEIGEEDSLKGKETVPAPPPKRESESMSDASVARRLLTGVIPASDKKEVDQLSENDLVARSFHALGQVVVFASSLALRSQEHLHDIDFHMARADSAELELVKAQKRAVKAETRLAELNEEILRPGTEVDDLKTTVAELTSKLAKAKELAIEDFKASEEFKAAVMDSAATYFGDGFEFCKRQLLHQFSNLGADVANMAMDPSFAEEEEATKEGGDHV